MVNNKVKKQENFLTWLFFFTWGFIFLSRLAVTFLLPIIKPELSINNQEVGYISFVSAGCYAISGIIFGYVSDVTGLRKRWLVILTVIAGVATSCIALTSTFNQLLVCLAIVGIGIGPSMTLIMTILARESSEGKFGNNSGIVSSGVAVIALFIGPTLLTTIATKASWQIAFLATGIPLIIIGILIGKYVDEVKVETVISSEPESKTSLIELFKYRNIPLCILIAITGMAGYWTIMLFAPTYMVDIAKVSVQQMGWITSAMGFIFIFYAVMVPKLSDKYGRKSMLIIFYALCIVAPLCMFVFRGSMVSVAAYVLFGGIPGAMIPLFAVLIPMETVPDRLRGTAGSIILGCGEIFGGALYPILAGRIGDEKGLPFMMLIGAILFAVTIIISLSIIESNKLLLKVEKVQEL